MRRTHAAILLFLVATLWCAAVAREFSALSLYASTPGKPATPPTHLPDSTTSTLPHQTRQPTLLVFLHPMCPCSHATVRELARILTLSAGKLQAHVIYTMPANAPLEWYHSALRDEVAAIPGLTASDDPDAQQTRRFGVRTSGQALLFSTDGTLLFSGGITAARGHEGENPAEDSLLNAIQNPPTATRTAAVFGCSLPHDPHP